MTAKIALVGAGGFEFPVGLTRDFLSHEELVDSDIRLMDVHAGRNERTRALIGKVVARHKLPTKVTATTDLEEALDGVGYVVVVWQVGGIEAYEHDVEIPRKYGVDQPVGDTLGPGGIFRLLRSAPAYRRVAKTMRRVAPDALMINYANPMAMNCMAVNRTGVRCVGLCHSVQGTSHLLATELGIPPAELVYKVAGYNHQAWYTELRHKGKDVYPELRRIMSERYPSPVEARSARTLGEVSEIDRQAGHGEVYHQEEVRTEIMRTFGYFHTESSHHGSEYVPWFRKNKEMVDAYIHQRWDYYQVCRGHNYTAQEEWVERDLVEKPLTSSVEYGSGIVHSMETDTKRVIYGTVPNWGPPGTSPDPARALVVSNLPWDAAVEVACLVDKNGIQPVAFGALPEQCAAVNRLGINVHQLAVEAAFTGDVQKVYQAVAMDPLAGALLTLPQIREMTDEMLAAERQWLPQFEGKA